MERTNSGLRSARGRILTALAAASLLSLVFLGSPGCGCSDDLPDTPGEEARECCCEFEWIPPREVGTNATIDVVLVGAHPSLQARAQPAVLTGVTFNQTPPLFDICVQDDHTLGATVTIELRQQPGDVLRGRALLTYDSVCDPTITTSPNLPTPLTSTDCGGECCCEIRWFVDIDLTGQTVLLAVAGSSPGITATLTPSSVANVQQQDIVAFQVCVNDDHPLPSSVTITATIQGQPNPLWQIPLLYQQNCIPTIPPPEPDSNDPLLWSPDCGEVPQCCCRFRYILNSTAPGPLRIEARNVDASLHPTIEPADVVGGIHEFSVCVNVNHDIDAFMDLVVVDPNNPTAVLDAATIQWDPNCQAGITEQTPPPPGVTDLGIFELIGCGELPDILVKPR